jgi:hypothetical protein
MKRSRGRRKHTSKPSPNKRASASPWLVMGALVASAAAGGRGAASANIVRVGETRGVLSGFAPLRDPSRFDLLESVVAPSVGAGNSRLTQA